MMELKRVDPLSLAKITAVVMAIFGFIFGLVVTLFTAALGSFFLSSATPVMFPFFGVIGIVAIIAFPILYGIMGFVFGAIWALIYNAVAAKVGGIMIDLKGPRISQSKR